MSEPSRDPISYYASPGLITDPGEHANYFDGLPRDIPSLCRIIQDALVHVHWAERYGLKLSENRKEEVGLRHVVRMLNRIKELDDRPLIMPRPLEKRLVGNCRDIATMLCAILRHQGTPARARCGFGTYFWPGKYEDHWVCEYWLDDEERWVMVDAQLDALQRKVLRIDFDPCDMPAGTFLPGGKAWQVCRAGQADPELFGIFNMHGMWFIRGNLIRDFASLNKMELLPWDCWRIMDNDDASTTTMQFLDTVAAMSLADNSAFFEVRSLYERDDRLKVPRVIRNHTPTGTKMIELYE